MNWWTVVFACCFLLVNLALQAQSQGVNLGELHWCDSLCLCHDETTQQMKCFEEATIYSLMEIEDRQYQRMSQTGFRIKDKLMWCSETCLCHKSGEKNFRCTDRIKLGEFIEKNAPELVKYLRPEVEVFDVRDIVDPADPDNDMGDVTDKKDRHDRRKNKKHRRNRKKPKPVKIAETTPSTSEDPTTQETITTSAPRVMSANFFPQPSTGRDLPSKSPEEAKNDASKQQQKNAMAEETSKSVEELKLEMAKINQHIQFNQHILLASIGIAVLAVIGVLILAIYSCCLRRSPKGCPSNGPRGPSLRHEENNIQTKMTNDDW